MYDGSFKNSQDVKINDELMGIDSTPRKVLNLYRGKEQMYNIVQNKGDTYTVNESHILSLKKRNKNYIETINISVKEYLQKSNKVKKSLKGYTTNAIDFSTESLIINPYYFGLWLGDGNTDCIRKITNTDKEIVEYLKNRFQSIDFSKYGNLIPVNKE
jgi:replicative DNA helicase